MLEAAYKLRSAYFQLLDGNILIGGTPIPIHDEQLPPTGTTASINLGSGNVAKCYILLTNQTETDISPKCDFHQECSITLDIVTKYPKGYGGKMLSEQISNQIQQLVLPDIKGQNLNVGPEFNCYYVNKELSRGISEFNLDSTVYRKILVFLNRLEELNTIT